MEKKLGKSYLLTETRKHQTVGGKPKKAAEKEIVTKLANDVAGVISVKDQMIIE